MRSPLLLSALCIAAAISLIACDDGGSTGSSECRVESIVDGDTLYVSCLDESVRLLLVDTPEIAREGGSQDEANGECFGAEATEYVVSRLPRGKDVRLEAGVRDRDQFGRYLRYLWVGNELFNETLVREGYALRYRQAEDTKYRARIIAAEDEARIDRRGLWAACDVSRG